jgi:hypothetical protein
LCKTKTAQDIFIGIGSWDPADKENMMVCDKQPKDFTTVRRGSKPLGGYEDLNPHGYIQTMNPNSVCIFGHQINKEQLNGW